MTNSRSITITNLNLTISFQPAYSLLNNFLLHDVPIHTTCGGHANCGCCRIKIQNGQKGLTQPNEREIKRLGKDLISQGWRLSCQTHSLHDLVVHIPTSTELNPSCSKQH